MTHKSTSIVEQQLLTDIAKNPNRDIETARVIDTLKKDIANLLEGYDPSEVFEVLSEGISYEIEDHEYIRGYVIRRLVSCLLDDDIALSPSGNIWFDKFKVENLLSSTLNEIRSDLQNPKFYKKLENESLDSKDFNSCKILRFPQEIVERLNMLVKSGASFRLEITILPSKHKLKEANEILKSYNQGKKSKTNISLHREFIDFKGEDAELEKISNFLEDQASMYKNIHESGDIALHIGDIPKKKKNEGFENIELKDNLDYIDMGKNLAIKIASSKLNSDVKSILYMILNNFKEYNLIHINVWDENFYHKQEQFSINLRQSKEEIFEELTRIISHIIEYNLECPIEIDTIYQ